MVRIAKEFFWMKSRIKKKKDNSICMKRGQVWVELWNDKPEKREKKKKERGKKKALNPRGVVQCAHFFWPFCRFLNCDSNALGMKA